MCNSWSFLKHLGPRKIYKIFSVIWIAIIIAIIIFHSWGKTFSGPLVDENDYARLRSLDSFQYPLERFYPNYMLTHEDRPISGKYHAAEDCFAEPGTPVYAIGDGKISFSGKAKYYGGLIIIDHPRENVYSLYGHLSTSRWRKKSGEVKKGECIAYVGTAEEGQTGDSHLHFGIRKGQKREYWKHGDRRWMAGWIKTYPPDIGWLEPSRIIDPELYLRSKEVRKSRKEVYLSSPPPSSAKDFKITTATCSEIDNIYQVIQNELGEGYRLADWNDILLFRDRIEAWADSVGIVEGVENSLMISRNGERFNNGPDNGDHHFLTRFNGKKPEHYAAWDNINNFYICLGAWHKLNLHILTVAR
jgi:hypothetical protein